MISSNYSLIKQRPLPGAIKILLLSSAFAALALSGCGGSSSNDNNNDNTANITSPTTRAAVIEHYADLAYAMFSDSLTEAQALQTAINALINDPTVANLEAAKEAYTKARWPYSQTEVYRFDSEFVPEGASAVGSVDDWEGQVNAWPLDEALIDYVDASSYVGDYSEVDNVINSDAVSVGTDEVDVSELTPEVLMSLNELGGGPANVATGFHAIEFLLWGQDTNGTNPGAGTRPVTDFATDGSCTSGNEPAVDEICEKRAEYLQVAAQLLVADLTDIVAEWDTETTGTTLRSVVVSSDETESLRRILFGMGSLSLGELASERMQVALIAGSTEDEHDCFSDTTHFSYYYNAKGIANVYTGEYTKLDGTTLSGPSIQDLVQQESAKVDTENQAAFADVETAMQTIVDSAENDDVKFDQLIATLSQGGSEARRKLVSDGVTALQNLTDKIEESAGLLGISDLNSERGSQF